MGYFEFLVASSLIYCFFIGIKLYRIRKHDLVLYRFCAVRREIVALLRDRGFEMHKADYFAVRDLLEAVNLTIHHFNDCKTTIFNIRFLSKMVNDLRESGQAIDAIAIPADKEIAKIFENYRRVMLRAFLTYTPFFRSELTARIFLSLVAAICSFAGKFGARSLCKVSEDLSWIIKQMNGCHPHPA